MAVLEALSEAEMALVAILQDSSGIDIAEFIWRDPDAKNDAGKRDSLFRCWSYQYPWYRNDTKKQIDQCARAIGKSVGIQMRAFAFPFLNPGNDMLISAPEMIHLDPVTKNIEDRLLSTRISREMLYTKGQATGLTHRPFEAKFVNGAKIIGRIPQKDGKGVKGMHPRVLEMDEAQDYPGPGWVELTETLRYGDETSRWRAHGVSRGVRDHYYKLTQSEDWHTHRYCLPGGTLVYGVDGPFAIEQAAIGTKVWSVESSGKLVEDVVTDVLDNGIKATWKVQAQGGMSLTTTYNHPYLVLNRADTRRTRKILSFEWVNAEDVQVGDYIVGVRELDSTGTRIPSPDEITQILQDHSPDREVPKWVWSASRGVQMSFLAGYLMGDGSISRQKRGQDAWQVGTSSQPMAKQLRALCHYLGLCPTAISEYKCSNWSDTSQWRFYVYAEDKYFTQIPAAYSSVRDGEQLQGLDKRLVARRVSKSESTGETVPTYDITVGTHHNYVAEGVVVHNTAMHRPDWTEEERIAKAEFYGSRDHPDYRRNILGLHGDAMSALFVLHRLMACVDSNTDSEYNANEYYHVRLNDEYVRDMGMSIENHLEFPGMHKKYKKIWVGMDVGLTNHPSEILIWGEEIVSGNQGKGQRETFTRLKCIGRVHLERISAPDQAKVLEKICEFYKPQAIGMDRTGLGLPIYQYAIDPSQATPWLNRCIRGYNFSEKIPVAFEQPEEGLNEWELEAANADPMERAVMANVLEYSSDQLRLLVDQSKIRLPWDIDMLKEWQGQAYYTARSSTNPYGKKEFNKGKFHALDAARMAILGYVQHDIENMLHLKEDSDVVPLLWLEGPDDFGMTGYGDAMGF